MKTKRIDFIDIARALAMIFIVLGHTIVHNGNLYWFYKLLYSFHVILFFIISGYIYIDSNTNKEFIKKKFKTLMIPYFIFSILFLIPYFIFGMEVNNTMNANGSTNILILIKEIIYGIAYNGSLKQNTSLWFLPALFTTETIYKLINNIEIFKKQNSYIKILILLVISFISTRINIVLPWGINTALTLMVFFQIGNTIKKENILNKIKNSFLLKLLLTITVIISLIIYQQNVTVSCSDYRYGNYIIFMFVSISLSLLILFISYKKDNSKLLQIIGKNTLSILIFHKLFILLFQTKIKVTSNILKNGNILMCLCLGLIYSFISIFISIIIGKIMEKFFPYLYGKRKEVISYEKN